MKIPRPFSLPHLVRNFHPDPSVIADKLIESARSIPPFNYLKVRPVVQDFLKARFSENQLRSGLEAIAPDGRRQLFGGLAHPIYKAFSDVTPRFVVPVKRQELVLSGGLSVPFDPGFVYANRDEEKLIIPHLLYWKTNPLQEHQLNLFFSLAKELLLEDDNVADAELRLLTMAENQSGARILRTYKDHEFLPIGSDGLNSALNTYRIGYELACERARYLPEKELQRKPKPHHNLDLF